MKVVLLLGPSSAGKSTLCATLQEEHDWHVFGGDQMAEKIEKELTPALLQILKDKNLIDPLLPYMNESAALELCASGLLVISKDGREYKHQFENPDYPGLDDVLKKIGFTGEELKRLSESLYAVGQAYKEHQRPDLNDRMFEDVFSDDVPADACIILDMVPPGDGDASEMIKEFKDRVEKQGEISGDDSIEFFTIIAYCPPQALSERIKNRNARAIQEGNLNNTREGLFPFHQLSQLISSCEQRGENDSAIQLSKLELLTIALQHLPPEVGADSQQKAKEIFKTGAHEYRELAKRFNALESREHVYITPRNNLPVDGILDFSQADPHELAEKVVEIVDDSSSQHQLSR